MTTIIAWVIVILFVIVPIVAFVMIGLGIAYMEVIGAPIAAVIRFIRG
jgi:hypothetical protein